MNYVGLHVHTHYSLFDGVATPKEYIDRASALGMPAIAITDHGTLSGHREMYRMAKEKGIKPILGLEGYMCADISDKRDKSEREGQQDLVYNHIILLAKNKIGLENLNKISELSWTDGFFKKPRFDFAILEKYKEGIIVSSACPSSVLVKALEEEEFALAKKYITWFKERFGSDYYIEVMPHTEAHINKYLIELADEFDIKIIVTPDDTFIRNALINGKIRIDGTNLLTQLDLTIAESLCGFTKTIKHINGKSLTFSIADIVKSGSMYVIKEEGLPKKDTINRGDLYVLFNVQYIDTLSFEKKKAIWEILTDKPFKDQLYSPIKVDIVKFDD